MHFPSPFRRLFRQAFSSRRPRVQASPLALERLEDRTAPANLAIVSHQLVDSQFNTVTSPDIGEQVFPQVVWTATGLPSDAKYTINYTLDGVTLTPPPFTFGAGASGSPTFNWAWGGWYATAGMHTVTITLNPDHAVTESDYTDNTVTFTFTAHSATDLPNKFLTPIGGTPFQSWTIVNYVDVNVLSPQNNDYTGGPYTYDGHTGHDITLPTFAGQDAGTPVFAAAPGTVTKVIDGNFDRQTSFQNGVTANEVDIDLGNGWSLQYFHFSENTITVSVGQHVTAGQILGAGGKLGGLNALPRAFSGGAQRGHRRGRVRPQYVLGRGCPLSGYGPHHHRHGHYQLRSFQLLAGAAARGR
jgi:hypothetical protein